MNRRGPKLVDSLDIEEFPRGRRTNVWCEIVHDALGRPLSVPVVVARGERPGPVFGITAAVHGNELNGIPVIHRLIDELDPRRLRGTIVAVVVVNVAGFVRQQREYLDGRDMNRSFPGAESSAAVEVFVHRFAERVIAHFDYLVDLHTASFGRANSLYVRANMHREITGRMAHLARPQIILHSPPSDHTLRGAAAERGIPSITIEVGDPQVFQQNYIRTTLIGIRSMLAAVGMTAKRQVAPGKPPILCSSSRWLRTDQGGLLEVFPDVAQKIEEGSLVARQLDIFGELVREYRTSEPGVVIGKSTNPVGYSGARILHLGRVVEELPAPADIQNGGIMSES